MLFSALGKSGLPGREEIALIIKTNAISLTEPPPLDRGVLRQLTVLQLSIGIKARSTAFAIECTKESGQKSESGTRNTLDNHIIGQPREAQLSVGVKAGHEIVAAAAAWQSLNFGCLLKKTEIESAVFLETDDRTWREWLPGQSIVTRQYTRLQAAIGVICDITGAGDVLHLRDLPCRDGLGS